MSTVLRLWTDGSQSRNGPAGWAFVAEERGRVLDERAGGVDSGASANAVELIAVVEALAYAVELPNPGTVQICSDSRYIADGVNTWLPAWIKNDWQAIGRRGGKSTKPIQNLKHWQRLAELSLHLPRLRPVRLVRGHSGAQFNELADRLARQAAFCEVAA